MKRITRHFGFDWRDDEPLAPDPMDFTRGALKRGLEIEGDLGTNPLAFGQIGALFEEFVNFVRSSPGPEDLSNPQMATYVESLEKQAEKILDSARSSYRSCYERAIELNLETPYSKLCNERLIVLGAPGEEPQEIRRP